MIQNAAGLSFSLIVFFCTSVGCVAVLVFRRLKLGAELGGPRLGAWLTCIYLMMLWFIFVLLSSLRFSDIIWEGKRVLYIVNSLMRGGYVVWDVYSDSIIIYVTTWAYKYIYSISWNSKICTQEQLKILWTSQGTIDLTQWCYRRDNHTSSPEN